MFYKTIDTMGRINLGKFILELADIKKLDQVAICYLSPNKFAIRPIDKIEGYKVLEGRKIDSKGRIIVPSDFGFIQWLVYFKDGELIIEGVD